jgi:hypothetical protein
MDKKYIGRVYKIEIEISEMKYILDQQQNYYRKKDLKNVVYKHWLKDKTKPKLTSV